MKAASDSRRENKSIHPCLLGYANEASVQKDHK